MNITIREAKILYAILTAQTTFQPGDFETADENFHEIADAVLSLREKEFITCDEPEFVLINGDRRINFIENCQLTERGDLEINRANMNYLNSEGDFSEDLWA